eukprot:Hpha_TRINITY_DN26213_c0_g1::TRINITY_DN26213_c0_g1_i1::g.184785::m.184785
MSQARLTEALAYTGSQGMRDESPSSAVLPAEITGVLVAAVVVLALMWVGLAMRVWVRGSAQLPWMLLVWQLTSALAAGLGFWSVSFVAVGNIVLDNNKRILFQTTEVAATRVSVVLNYAELVAETLASRLRANREPLPTYPQAHLLLRSFLDIVPSKETYIGVYWGGASGEFASFRYTAEGCRIGIGYPASPRERRCGEKECHLLPACGEGNCSFCVSSSKGEGDCPQWNPAQSSFFTLDLDSDNWDAPHERILHCVLNDTGGYQSTARNGAA